MENKKKFRWTYDWTFVCVCVRHARVYDPTVDDELKVPNITDLNDDDDDDDVTALEGPPQRENSTRVFPFTPFHPLPSPDGARHRPSARTKISRFSYGKKEKKKQKTKTNYATTARHLLPLTWLHFNTLRVCVRARLYNPCVYRIDSGPRSRPRKKLNGQGGKKHSDAAPLGRRTLEDIASRHVGRKEKKKQIVVYTSTRCCVMKSVSAFQTLFAENANGTRVSWYKGVFVFRTPRCFSFIIIIRPMPWITGNNIFVANRSKKRFFIIRL